MFVEKGLKDYERIKGLGLKDYGAKGSSKIKLKYSESRMVKKFHS